MKRIFVLLVSIMVLFSSMSSFAVSDTSSKVGKTTIVTGEITRVNPGVPYNKLMLAVNTSTQTYILTGMTDKLNMYVGYTAKITGNTYKGPQGILMLNVKSYKIVRKLIPTPTKVPVEKIKPTVFPTPTATNTPTPSQITDNITLNGYLYNLNSDMKKFYLKSEKGLFELIGNTEGMEKVVGNMVEVTGNYVYTLVATECPLFSVVSYKVNVVPPVTPTPSQITNNVTLNGYLYNLNSDMKKFYLKSEKGLFELIGNTEGMEKVVGNMVEVTGNYVYTLVATEYPMFSVISYKVNVVPPVTPTPVVIESSKVHTIISTKIDHFGDASLGLDVKDLSGVTTVSWTEGTKSAFFNSKVTVLIDGIKVNYQVELIETVDSDKGSITGLFNIIKDGTVIAKGVKGEVYGLETSIGSYFKFYSQEAGILIAPIATERFDF